MKIFNQQIKKPTLDRAQGFYLSPESNIVFSTLTAFCDDFKGTVYFFGISITSSKSTFGIISIFILLDEETSFSSLCLLPSFLKNA